MGGCHVQPEQMFNLIFGYSDRFLEYRTVAGTGGNDVAYSSEVPAGEVWIVTGVSAQHNDPTARATQIGVYDGASQYAFQYTASLAQWAMLAAAVQWVMKEGDHVYAQFNSLLATKTGYLRIGGYKMIVTQ